jgi:hypothetical protein
VKNTAKRLNLNAETVRNLGQRELSVVNGGVPNSTNCDTWGNTLVTCWTARCPSDQCVSNGAATCHSINDPGCIG